ncbi:hypothetical protein RFI_14979 [Reticulomyxa filosa]|uniref:Uncharacterized protein n=1 Tax=Reticulomyxa filosa TaxID=46433 RepID=X6N831_RETFI|nr:hypothetical protein RFI_14979 [Reticulomyxa filosa]|eukprot:ETO22221.1 hypothetical protein RFI_14979 [Reticulomyxa filosa]
MPDNYSFLVLNPSDQSIAKADSSKPAWYNEMEKQLEEEKQRTASTAATTTTTTTTITTTSTTNENEAKHVDVGTASQSVSTTRPDGTENIRIDLAPTKQPSAQSSSTSSQHQKGLSLLRSQLHRENRDTWDKMKRHFFLHTAVSSLLTGHLFPASIFCIWKCGAGVQHHPEAKTWLQLNSFLLVIPFLNSGIKWIASWAYVLTQQRMSNDKTGECHVLQNSKEKEGQEQEEQGEERSDISEPVSKKSTWVTKLLKEKVNLLTYEAAQFTPWTLTFVSSVCAYYGQYLSHSWIFKHVLHSYDSVKWHKIATLLKLCSVLTLVAGVCSYVGNETYFNRNKYVPTQIWRNWKYWCYVDRPSNEIFVNDGFAITDDNDQVIQKLSQSKRHKFDKNNAVGFKIYFLVTTHLYCDDAFFFSQMLLFLDPKEEPNGYFHLEMLFSLFFFKIGEL